MKNTTFWHMTQCSLVEIYRIFGRRYCLYRASGWGRWFLRKCLLISLRIHDFVCQRTVLCVYVCVCVYIYIYTRTHTHMSMYVYSVTVLQVFILRLYNVSFQTSSFSSSFLYKSVAKFATFPHSNVFERLRWK